MKNILITGGAGYIGSHAVERFLGKDYNVIVLDNFSMGFRESIDVLKRKAPIDLLEVDLRNWETLKKSIKEINKEKRIDAVVHFAALCSVSDSMKNPSFYFENNSYGTLNLLKVMHEEGINKIIFSSSCAVYGETNYLPVDEKHPTLPTNPYGQSKLMAEQMIQWFGRLHNIDYVILRYFNVTGCSKEGHIGDSKKPSPHLIQNAVRGALGIEPFYLTCPIVDSPDGTPLRDYVDVLDLVDAHIEAYEHLNSGGGSEIINLGKGKGLSVLEIVKEVEKMFGVELPKQKKNLRGGEYAEIYANITKAKKLLNWEPKISLKESVQNLKNWYEKHPTGFAS